MVALNRRLATLSVPKSLVGIAVVGVAYFAALSAQRIHFVEQQNTVALGYRSENAPQAFLVSPMYLLTTIDKSMENKPKPNIARGWRVI